MTSYLSPDTREKSRGAFITRRGFKKQPKVSHGTSRVATFDFLECEDLGAVGIQGRATGDEDFSDDPASSEVGVVGGVPQVSPSWGSLPSSTPICELGSKGPKEPTGRCKLQNG